MLDPGRVPKAFRLRFEIAVNDLRLAYIGILPSRRGECSRFAETPRPAEVRLAHDLLNLIQTVEFLCAFLQVDDELFNGFAFHCAPPKSNPHNIC